MLSRDQFADRAADRLSVHVRKVNIGGEGGQEQIVHEAIAYDMHGGAPVAHVQIQPPVEQAVEVNMADSWHQKAFTDPGGQMRMPIVPMHGYVSHALASTQGQKTGAAHVALSALSEHFNERPFADEALTEFGSRMARSAARRGLIRGHPGNPEMETTIPRGWFTEPGSPELEHLLRNAHKAFQLQDRAHSVGYLNMPPVTELSHQEVRRAAQRLTRPRQEVPPSQGEQLSIQFG